MKVLFIAFACEPERGSEPAVGWSHVWHASRKRPAWVLTDPVHREKIDRWVADHGDPNIRVFYYSLPSWTQWMWRSLLTVNIYYYLWNVGAARSARRLHMEHGFDVVHHVSYVRYWMPSAGANLGIPFLWGPLGGGESAPRAFLQGMDLTARIEEWTRELIRGVFERDPRLRACARSASVSIASSEQTAERMRQLGARDPLVMPAICISPSNERGPYVRPEDGKVRFISAGRLLRWKGFHFGLEAFARAAIPNGEFVVMGSGPCLRPLQELARRLGIADRVRFTGNLSWREALRQFQEADVLVHPSLHDSGCSRSRPATVLVEAMEMAKPVICLSFGGPGFYVNEDCGYLIPARSVEQAIDDIASAMRNLASSRSLRLRLGAAGRQRVLQHTWERRTLDYETIYQKLVTGKR